LKACLTKLGLEVSQEAQAVPSLSPLHLSSAQPGEIEELLQIWRKEGVLTSEGQSWCITGENDTFRVKENDTWSVDCLTAAVTDVPIQTSSTQTDGTSSRIPDYNALPKTLIPHTSSLPPPKETPHFNHAAFYKHLHTYNTHHPTLTGDFGRVLIYSEVLTSTQTILDKNPTWLSHLPIGTTATATTQVSGRGRGTNTWVSPPGSMMFSTVLKHPLSLSPTAPVVFVQYLAALAVVAGIHSSSSSSSDPSHARLPIKLKWPNDIYALHPDARASPEDPRSYVKIGGVLVNSSYAGGDYTLVVGVGLNLANPSPTTSVAALVRDFLPPSSTSSSSTAVPPPPPPQPEKVLASILVQFENLYARFCQTGWNERLERMYYDVWLHMDQVVTLEEHGGMKARIKGITRDWGMLVAEEVVDEGGRGGLRLGGGEGGGKRFELQSDSNSFDFFRGLVKRKV
jgi:biotin--protein ligase